MPSIGMSWTFESKRRSPKLRYREERVKVKLFCEVLGSKGWMESVKGVLMEWTAGGAATTLGLGAEI